MSADTGSWAGSPNHDAVCGGRVVKHVDRQVSRLVVEGGRLRWLCQRNIVEGGEPGQVGQVHNAACAICRRWASDAEGREAFDVGEGRRRGRVGNRAVDPDLVAEVQRNASADCGLQRRHIGCRRAADVEDGRPLPSTTLVRLKVAPATLSFRSPTALPNSQFRFAAEPKALVALPAVAPVMNCLPVLAEDVIRL